MSDSAESAIRARLASGITTSAATRTSNAPAIRSNGVQTRLRRAVPGALLARSANAIGLVIEPHFIDQIGGRFLVLGDFGKWQRVGLERAVAGNRRVDLDLAQQRIFVVHIRIHLLG